MDKIVIPLLIIMLSICSGRNLSGFLNAAANLMINFQYNKNAQGETLPWK